MSQKQSPDQKNRDRITLIAGGAVFLIVAYLFLFMFPTLGNISKNQKLIKKNEKDIAELKVLIEEYKKNGPKDSAKFEGDLSPFIEQNADKAGITITNMRPFGDNGEGLDVRISEIGGAQLIQLLYDIENSGVIVSKLNMKDFRGTGIWSVSMTVEAGK